MVNYLTQLIMQQTYSWLQLRKKVMLLCSITIVKKISFVGTKIWASKQDAEIWSKGCEAVLLLLRLSGRNNGR